MFLVFVLVTADPLQLDLPSEGTGGEKAGETPQGPHWKHIPVGCVAYGTAFVKYPRNVLLQCTRDGGMEGRRDGGMEGGGHHFRHSTNILLPVTTE